jgi:hypothetical protein
MQNIQVMVALDLDTGNPLGDCIDFDSIISNPQ